VEIIMKDAAVNVDAHGSDATPNTRAEAAGPGSAIQTPKAEPSRAPVLLFDRVSKWYGPVIGVNHITLELRGGITGLVGANGSGKSTLLRLGTGQLRPSVGTVAVRGFPARDWRAKRHVGYCPDVDVFYEDMSGFQFVETMARLCGFTAREARLRAEAVIERVGMAGRCDRCIRGYSKGMRQRIKLAQALLHDPQLLILDEPLSGIDPIGRHDFLDLFLELAEQGKCLLVSSHELEELEKLTDHVAIMAHGRVAAVGTIGQIRDLLDQHPMAIRIDATAPRALAGHLLAMPDVVGVDVAEFADAEVGSLVVRARNPRQFFAEFGRLVIEEAIEVRRLEPLDASASAILGYLLGSRG
jgi:ABC-2 type transport system ATP-binding protein